MSDLNEDNHVGYDTKLQLSLLDWTVIWNGASASQVFKEALDMAVFAEQLGYERYWISESHNTADHASSSPEVLMAQLAAFTTGMKVGTSNLMLPHQSTLKVVENFRTLEGIYPGRIDLGFSLSIGEDLLAAMALHRTHDLVSSEQFPEQLAELLAYLTDSYSTSRGKIMASPKVITKPGVWMQGSNHEGAQYATEYGLGLVLDHLASPAISAEVLRAYRRFFKPSIFRAEPHSILIVPILCADTDEKAELLARPLDLWKLRQEQGADLPPPSVDEALAYLFSSKEEEIRLTGRAGTFIGSASLVGSKLRQLAEEAAVNEVMIVTLHPDIKVRQRSIELLAKEFQLTTRQQSEGVISNVRI